MDAMRLVAALVVAPTMIMAAVACSSVEDPGPRASQAASDSQPSSPDQTPPGPATTWGGDWCLADGAECQEHSGLPTLRLQGEADTIGDVVLVDLGGPGIPVEQTATAVANLGLLAKYDVLIVGEAWEVNPPSEACLAREGQRVRSFATLAGQSCDVQEWGFEAGAYRDAVRAALGSGDTLTAAVGVSFGAVRVVAATSADTPVMLVTPAPPHGTVDTIAKERVKALRSRVAAACTRPERCLAPLGQIEGGLSRQRNYEWALGLIGAAKDRDEFDRLAARLSDLEVQPLEMRRRAYAATYRYGEGAALPNLLGYRGATCSVYDSSPRARRQGLERVLTGVLSCGADSGTQEASPSGRGGCVFLARGDLVTPDALTAPWFTSGSKLRQSRSRVRDHAALEGAALKALQTLPGSLDRC